MSLVKTVGNNNTKCVPATPTVLAILNTVGYLTVPTKSKLIIQLLYSLYFLQRVRIARNAERCTS